MTRCTSTAATAARTICPHCSQVYKRDARQLVLPGLAGGKGVPDSVAEHPCVFATFTAPSFGPVHARRERGGKVLPCRPRRDASKRVCPHGRDISCPVRHCPDDPRLGRPMCPGCYDYERAVTFNAGAAKIWQRFVTYLPRHLARVAGIRVKDCRELVKPSGSSRCRVPGTRRRPLPRGHPPGRQRQRRRRFRASRPAVDRRAPGQAQSSWLPRRLQRCATCGRTGRRVLVRFGPQTDVRIVRSGTETALSRDAVANYIAKYVTKAVGVPGLPASRIRHASELRLAALPGPSQADDRDRAGPRLPADTPTSSATAATPSPSPAATQSPLASSAASASSTAKRSAGQTANWTPGAVHSMNAWSWCSRTSPTRAPATRPARPALSLP